MNDLARVGVRRFWTTKEEAILHEHYSKPGGVERCVALLLGRTRGAIMQHGGHVLGLRAHLQPKDRKHYAGSEHIDQAIRFVYQNNASKGAIRELAAKIDRPRWWVSKRAASLGLAVPRYKDAPWSPAETGILEENCSRHPKSIRAALKRAGFSRTETAIIVKRKRLHLETKDPNVYTATDLGNLMGVDRGTVTHWIERFGLPARRKPTDRTEAQGGDPYQITRRALRLWIGENAARVDLRKVDRFWFIDLLIGLREEKAAA